MAYNRTRELIETHLGGQAEVALALRRRGLTRQAVHQWIRRDSIKVEHLREIAEAFEGDRKARHALAEYALSKA